MSLFMNDKNYINKIFKKIGRKPYWEKVSFQTDHKYMKLSLLIHEETINSRITSEKENLF